ncbi:MAG: SpoIIE family protein phosphatase [Fibrella sp.]|nr:SpoIIE family protein phosphatase [Armatimonadota bacterium]
MGTEFERQFRRAMTERVTVRFVENYHVAGEYDDWLDVTAYPAAEEDGGGLHLVYRDVTERVQRERREQFLAELAERARTLTDADAVIADAVRSLGQFLSLSRCTFADIDTSADTCTIHLDYCADDTVASIAGTWTWSAFGPFVATELGQGRAVAVDDVLSDPVRVPPENADAYDAIGVRAHITAPAVYSARLVSVISAQSATPRQWKPEEIGLLRTVAERTWLTVEIARQQRALQEAERRERTRLNDMFTHVPAFMAALRGTDHVFEMANPSYYQVIGHRELLGKPVAEALPEIAEQGFVALLDRVYQSGEPFIGSGVRVLLQREQNGPLHECFLDFIYQPLRDEDNTVTGILIHGTDVTEVKRLETARRRGEERFRSLVEATAQIIWDVRAAGEFVTEQPQWAAYTGQVFEQYRGAGWIDAVHPEERAETLRAWREALQTRTLYEVEHRLRRHDGEYRHFSVRAAPVLEEDGSVREWVGAHDDVTERKEAEGRERFLSEVTARMQALLDPEEVLYETAKAVGEYTGAHRCLYIEVDEEADTLTIRRDYVRGVASIAGTFPLDAFGPPIIENLRVGNVTQSDDIEKDPRLGPEHRETFRALNFRAFLGVPLHKAGRWVAILAIHFSQAREWTPEEAELLIAVVERTWLAVENARLYRAMQEFATRNGRIAETLQRSMLVAPPPDSFSGIELATDYEAAWDEAFVGGDFHDTFALAGGKVALVVGDATGKGLEAATHTAEVKYVLRAYLRESPDPALALARLNRFLIDGQQFGADELSCIAVAVTVLDPRTGDAACACAGAEPPLLVREATGVAEEIYARGTLVGASAEAGYDAVRFTIEAGDLLVMTTDGITEARNPIARRRFFADNGFTQAAQAALRDPVALSESARSITARAKAFAGGKLHDDVCLLLARRDQP